MSSFGYRSRSEERMWCMVFFVLLSHENWPCPDNTATQFFLYGQIFGPIGDLPRVAGAIHSTKLSGNFGPKLNGSVRSNRKSFEKTGPPFKVVLFSWSDRLEFWLNGSRPEAFHARFPVSVKTCRPVADEAPRRTREKTSGTQGIGDRILYREYYSPLGRRFTPVWSKVCHVNTFRWNSWRSIHSMHSYPDANSVTHESVTH